jgi:uncharacterized damage-inducible protein DinB
VNTKLLILDNLRHSEQIVLARIEDMRSHAMVFPTPNGGCHTLWVLGHLAYIEALVIDHFMLGNVNPLTHWQAPFDGDSVSSDPHDFPSFDEVLVECRGRRSRTRELLESMNEDDLDQRSKASPPNEADLFETYRKCFQYVANHWFMHRGQLADARRAAGIDRMWF